MRISNLILVLVAVTLLCNCKKEKEAKPVAAFTMSTNITNINEPITFTDNSTNASDYLWTFGDGTSSTEQNPIHSYSNSGAYDVILQVTNGAGSDDFSQGEGDWTFQYCDHSYNDGVLTTTATEANTLSLATTNNFPALSSGPWTLKADIAIVSSTTDVSTNGIAVESNDQGDYAVEYLWFGVELNDEGADWVWLMWIPSLLEAWLPWDNTCYGISDTIMKDGQWNSFEIKNDANENFTIKVNGTILTSANTSINQLEQAAGIEVSTGIKNILLLGGSESEINWDNISLIGQAVYQGYVKAAESRGPPPVSREYIHKLFDQRNQGHLVTAKELLSEKLGNSK